MELYDLHTHSNRSDGRMSPADIAQEARRRGIGTGLTDHCLYYGMKSEDDFRAYQRDVQANGLYLGLEIDMGRPLVLPSFVVADLDYIIGSIHHFATPGGDVLFSPYFRSKTYGEPYEYPAVLGEPAALLEAIGDLIVRTLEREPIDILGHVTVLPPRDLLGGDKAFSRDWCARVIRAAVQNDVAIELSGHWKVPHREFLEIALDEGAQFATGSDAHKPEGLFDLEHPRKMIAELGIGPERLFVPRAKPPRIRR